MASREGWMTTERAQREWEVVWDEKKRERTNKRMEARDGEKDMIFDEREKKIHNWIGVLRVFWSFKFNWKHEGGIKWVLFS